MKRQVGWVKTILREELRKLFCGQNERWKLLSFGPGVVYPVPQGFSSVAQSCLTLCDRMNRNMPGLPVHHPLPEFTQTHIHWVSDAIQPFHPLSSPFPPAFNFFPASSSFPRSLLFSSGGQKIRASASASVPPMNIQDWFPLGWTGFFSLLSKGLSRVFSSTTIWKQQYFSSQLSLWFNSHIHAWLLENAIALTIQTFVSKVMALLFNMLSRFVIAFLPRSKHLLILWLQSPSTVIWSPRK